MLAGIDQPNLEHCFDYYPRAGMYFESLTAPKLGRMALSLVSDLAKNWQYLCGSLQSCRGGDSSSGATICSYIPKGDKITNCRLGATAACVWQSGRDAQFS